MPVNRSIASSTAASRRASEAESGLNLGEGGCERPLACAAEIRDAVGVFAGEDFVGEIDLARSE